MVISPRALTAATVPATLVPSAAVETVRGRYPNAR